MSLSERLDRYGVAPETAWVAGLVAAAAAIAGAAVAFTEQVYYGFLWRYFWGPVFADALNADCAVYVRETAAVVVNPGFGCSRETANFVAEPGYTFVSEVGYALTLLYMLAGVYLLLRRLDLEPYRGLFFALVPLVLFGGALRVVEDASDAAAREGVEPALSYPLNTLFISPLIYFTVFFVAIGALLAGLWFERTGRVGSYTRPLAAFGAVAVLLSVGSLLVLSATTAYVDFFPAVSAVTLGLASLIAVGVYGLVDRVAPWINEGTGRMGVVVLWAHAVDGVANVIASDWATAFGLPALYGSKHPVDRVLSGVAESVPGLAAVPGDSWLFLVVKVLVPVAILAIFEAEFLEESPRYAVLLLVAIVAVGLGPGTRDMLRVTFGI